jgi:ABC-type antimicrobial peptide transport system permease subunit
MPLTWTGNIVSLKLDPDQSTQVALDKVHSVFKEFAPDVSFDYKFVDEQYAFKFSNEVRIGQLASVFATLAIVISCLGLFGMASFVAEQRTKEMGIRKVLGASMVDLWQMLSKDFVVLVLISCLIAIPASFYFMNGWLQRYEYRTEISAWIFVTASVGALLTTLLIVSFQTFKAAITNPVKSLRSE